MSILDRLLKTNCTIGIPSDVYSHLLWQVRRQTDLIAACIERRRRLAFRTRPLICMKTHQSPVDLPSHKKTRRRAVDLREKSLHSCRSARQNGDIDARTMSSLTGYVSLRGPIGRRYSYKLYTQCADRQLTTALCSLALERLVSTKAITS